MAVSNVGTDMSLRDTSTAVLDTVVDGVVAENSSRGGFGYAAARISELERRQMRARMENPFSYTIGDVLESPDGYRYRSGNEQGAAFFTVDDFLRLRRDRFAAACGPLKNAYAVELYEKKNSMRTETHPAAAYRTAEAVAADSLRPRSEVFFSNGEANMVVKDSSKSKGRLALLCEKYMKAPQVILTRSAWKLASGAIASICLVVVFAMLLSLPVVMKILIHKEAGVIADLDRNIRTAEAEVKQLEIELDRKNDRATLERLAVEEYGMVRLDRSDYSVMQLNPDDAIETMEKEKQGGAVPTLLKALGLRSDD